MSLWNKLFKIKPAVSWAPCHVSDVYELTRPFTNDKLNETNYSYFLYFLFIVFMPF